MGIGVFLLYALAVARVTGLVAADELTRPIREWILSRLDDQRRLHTTFATLISCQWCVSIYIAFGGAVIVLWAGTSSPWVWVPMCALAASQVTGMLSSLGRE